ncbi:methyltransferase [Acrocarpospora pleiomorpha]|uniref:Methyltransferase n=1 Tax=Acrocarpospora pleiomorpha TaxID=90975 RepID=A0A5M3XK54_9ACTN|nr:SAM-dependent methyltransferase [Acrocarpospora pleiomorpha]GES18488.1 methyltransferase [Acrocarpospora pleiomorpha]
MPENNFDERIAETYEAKWPELFDPAVVDPAVSFLADLAGSGAAHFATTGPGGTFQLAYLVRNTITNLTTQDEQVECFRNVAAHLEPGGCFVIEVYIPELRRLPPGQTIHPFTVTPAHLGFEEHDVASQIAYSRHYWVVDAQLETRSSPHRYVWPSELDLMVRLAGMTLQRWANWNREPFTSDSTSHISVWQKTPQR